MEPRKFRRASRKHRGVDATGRYMPSRQACREETISSRTLYGQFIYANGVGINSALFTCKGYPRTSTMDKQMTDTSLFIL
ncbi:MAG: hypothetical protein IJV23_06725 [Prevotella sp.]|nr:hypothetical protein [Prevotella sp.]